RQAVPGGKSSTPERGVYRLASDAGRDTLQTRVRGTHDRPRDVDFIRERERLGFVWYLRPCGRSLALGSRRFGLGRRLGRFRVLGGRGDGACGGSEENRDA